MRCVIHFPCPFYDEFISVLRRALDAARVGHTEKLEGFRRPDRLTRAVEEQRQPLADFASAVSRERAISASLGGRTVFDDASRRPTKTDAPSQLSLFPT